YVPRSAALLGRVVSVRTSCIWRFVVSSFFHAPATTEIYTLSLHDALPISAEVATMSEKKLFLLPDLGEGLPDAEIVEWLVEVGQVVKLDEPLVSMETAKAVVEVPSPYSGKVLRLAGGPGDVIATGSWLVEIEIDPSLPQRAEAQDTGHSHGHKPAAPAETPAPAPAAAEPAPEAPAAKASGDAGTVVGAMQTSDAVRSEQ